MAVAYAKLYELILKKVKDEKEAEELYNAIIEIVKEEKLAVKTELKDELRGELATKEDIKYLDGKIEMVKKELEYKLIIHTLIILFAIIITNPNAIELIKLLFGFK
ncbi:hypothetical protein MJ_0349 [Methanocaldococcus jannaschii DSM 2661]|uniref:Uncharacterized protein MJ0349 n=1 Tax=Methanocaldococcus jannaschii (strain ATCC 43067 / DSM 2661 / JAL-1 / JCM 10045 / NBRC 100440) TaxID=243232 RepID=Y349_METJA|nr:hypothetical protein [Methanocaldococcus jannaschii]Q57795.1 RecName: Full=Uncharacterized protein MJ0349 [Methanocaldococcus jannaschii DSM 2661]AAB98338.1 hypothetical protein MJ_0349 [Methanocaldococcus jannaschii DSM 2661]